METKQMASVWKGSRYTASDIAHQILQRWGEDAVKEYSPEFNCFTFKGWQERGYRVKAGEKALRTFTFIRKSADVAKADGTIDRKWNSFPKDVCLFFIRQVEKR